MKASFFRNVTNHKTLYNNSTHYIGVVAEYHSIATIYLEENEFAVFCENFLSSYDYLIPFIDKAVIAHGVWTCVSVVYGDTTILAVMDHYQYPRYLAIPPQSNPAEQHRKLSFIR